MWYEILPTFFIIVGAMAAPHYCLYYLNRLILGNSFRRSLLTVEERRQYVRDRLLTDDPYLLRGLDDLFRDGEGGDDGGGIGDEEECEY